MTVVLDDIETPDQPVDSVDSLEVRRHAPLAAGVGLAAAAIAIAYLARAAGSGSWTDWLLCLVMGALAAVHLAAFVDARSPLLVVDRHGVRLRRGRSWRGVAWPEVERVEHLPRHGMLRDGRLVVVGVHDDEISVPLSLSTRLVGVRADELTETLAELADGATEVLEVLPRVPAEPAEDPVEQLGDEPHDQLFDQDQDHEPETAAVSQVVASVTPSPLRAPVVAIRAEITQASDETVAGHDRIAPAAAAPDVTIVIDPTTRSGQVDVTTAPGVDPVIGPVLSTSRTRLGLSVDQLAERTRIRPHVIESIEVDDFSPCGGDFYARGHLRTLARVLGTDATPLLATYDERYADAPIDPRRVFEAELATGAGGSIRGVRGGPNWSVLIAAVMAVVLIWSVARLIMDGPVPLADNPRLNNSGGLNPAAAVTGGAKVPVVVTAVSGGAKITVRDAKGVVFNGTAAFGQSISVEGVPPIRVSSTDGSVEITVDGEERGALGATGQDAQDTFVVR